MTSSRSFMIGRWSTVLRRRTSVENLYVTRL